jgi:serine/threonine-protein kinase
MIKVIKTILFVITFMVTAASGTYLTIHLLIRSAKTVVTPDLVGKDVVYSLELLSDLKLNTKVKGSQFDPDTPKHHVISQDPDPGTEIKQGRDVRLIISKGTRQVVFPNLKGVNLAQARILLEENGLHLGHVSHVYSSQRPRLEVLAQYPLPVQHGLRGDKMDLLVSEGPSPLWYRMMPLEGLPLDGAVESAEENQLSVSAVHYSQSADTASRTVTRQEPLSGYPVAAASGIELTIAWQPGSSAKVDAHSTKLYRYRSAVGFLKESIRVRVNWPDMTLDFFNKYVSPDNEIWLLIPNSSKATLFLYSDDQLLKTDTFN